MQHFILALYILFFATGFMGGAALLLMRVRMRSRLLTPLLIFQILFFLGSGLIIIIYYLQNLPSGLNDPAARIVLFLVTGTNTAVWAVVILLIKRISPPAARLRGFPAVAVTLAALVIAKSIANMILVLKVQSGTAGIAVLTGIEAWNFGGHILTGFAMAAFGLLARGPLNPGEPPALRPLMKAYGLCAILFAPAGITEAAIQSTGFSGLSELSLDHLFYFSWNCINERGCQALQVLCPG